VGARELDANKGHQDNNKEEIVMCIAILNTLNVLACLAGLVFSITYIRESRRLRRVPRNYRNSPSFSNASVDARPL